MMNKECVSTSSTNPRSPRLFQEQVTNAHFIEQVAFSNYYNADKVLRILSKVQTQELLLTNRIFTDYSGRKFNCSAYEYAYWANDTRMCRLLEKYMDAATMAEMFQRCLRMDGIGLDYEQNGQKRNSLHFNLIPLKTALKNYAYGLDQWVRERQWDTIKKAWLQIGQAQRDLPAHVVLEYCRLNGRFDPTPNFNETDFPRNRTFEQENTKKEERWFPLSTSQTEGLGISFSIYKGTRYGLPMSCSKGGQISCSAIKSDHAAIQKLDKVRTTDRQQSLENLSKGGRMYGT